MKLTPKVIEALVNLRGNPHFAAVMEGMAEHEKEQADYCTTREGVSLHRAQGEVSALKAWRDAFQSAPDHFKKIQGNNR